ncbi:cell wall-associated hydrolase [Liquorilactobacillus ghanensis DSM 18630]|uniref:Cell wall-associated hydrolase n=1 Tax=Liquorilactobacillus ghanensis DSM 18630 TaxID=1423750 RepID=A0A0R1VWV8_9LACO|nr:NlpC/P60 family protein [Liquorilactobacillus ghanensis]KRM07539.1 cell wall-associated hydrolase [Liquorilactobacillus ghanensis DSM 18630]
MIYEYKKAKIKLVLYSIIGVITFFILIIAGATGAFKQQQDQSDNDNSTVGLDVSGMFNKTVYLKHWESVYGSGVLKDKGNYTITVAQKYGINPALIASIMATESAYGKSSAIKNDNNPSGQMVGSKILHYDTLEQGIDATGKTLHNLVVTRKLNTVQKLGSAYAPVGAGNDPTNLNSNWVPVVTQLMASFGGKSSDNLAASGSSSGGSIKQFDAIMAEAKKYIGQPYVWGGSTPATGFDCSGFTSWCYSKAGIKIPRTSQAQWAGMKHVAEKDAKAGDLVFFQGTDSQGGMTHVGIYIGNGRMLDSEDSGIKYANITSGYWKNHLGGFATAN